MADVAYYTREGLDKLREELQQLKTSGRANIAKAIAEAHAGTIIVSDVPAGGARFTLVLPI